EEGEGNGHAQSEQDGDREGEEKKGHSAATSGWSSSISAVTGPWRAMSTAAMRARIVVLTVPMSTGMYTHDIGMRSTGDFTIPWVSMSAQASMLRPTPVAAT